MEDFVVLPNIPSCVSDEESRYTALFEFIDVLPSEKIPHEHKRNLKDFFESQEVTLDDFTKLSEDNIRTMLTNASPIPLGPLYRFLEILSDYRRSHSIQPAPQRSALPAQWTTPQVISWLNTDVQKASADHINLLESAVRQFGISGHDLFHFEGRKQFEVNVSIPEKIRSCLLQLSSDGSPLSTLSAPDEKADISLPEPTPIPQSKPIGNRWWYWYNDSHGFIRFEAATCHEINVAMAQDRSRLSISQGKFFKGQAGKYEMFFDYTRPEGPHHQRNTVTSESRAVISHRHEFIASGLHASLVNNAPRV